jgi:hypothetical protein
MNDILHDYIHKFVLVFFDHILIFSSSYNSHLQHVRALLLRLHDHQLKLKKSKCHFVVEQAAYIRHVITTGGVAMDAEKVDAMRAWPIPWTVRVVGVFLGLTGNYWKLIRGCCDMKHEAFRSLGLRHSVIAERGIPMVPWTTMHPTIVHRYPTLMHHSSWTTTHPTPASG